MTNEYTDEIRRVRSLLIVTSLQKRKDLKARKLISQFSADLTWEPLADLMIDPEAWRHVVADRGYDPKLVFCHPQVLLHSPATSVHYRGLCGLSLKATRDYAGAVEGLEEGGRRSRLDPGKALKVARTYNTFICSIVKNSTDWTLENGYRTVVATLGITLDGVMRNRIGGMAEERIRTLILEWLIHRSLLVEPSLTKDHLDERLPSAFTLANGTVMRFGSEPDIAFESAGSFLAVVEIKGGIDPAGALERYGAATKSFQHAISTSPHCKNFYLTAVRTPELQRRIEADRLVEKTFDIIEVLEDQSVRQAFFAELFHHALRLI